MTYFVVMRENGREYVMFAATSLEAAIEDMSKRVAFQCKEAHKASASISISHFNSYFISAIDTKEP